MIKTTANILGIRSLCVLEFGCGMPGLDVVKLTNNKIYRLHVLADSNWVCLGRFIFPAFSKSESVKTNSTIDSLCKAPRFRDCYDFLSIFQQTLDLMTDESRKMLEIITGLVYIT